MKHSLDRDQARDFMARGFTRRDFGRIFALMTGAAALPFYDECALAQAAFPPGRIPPDAVRINLNENPLGPCREALQAMAAGVPKCGRYLVEETRDLEASFAEREGLDRSCVAAFAGSSTPLHHAVLAFTGPNRPLIMADPGYDGVLKSAEFIGSKIVKVPLTALHAHDVRAMAAAAERENAGLIFICNPNNPTGTVTSKEDIDWLAGNMPQGAVLLLDEAYIHFCEDEPGTSLVRQDRDVILLRTFSKLYGMAGLRAGVAMAKPKLLARVRPYSSGPLPAVAMIGARASLRVPNLVAERRKRMRRIREDVFSFLEKHRFDFVPSVACMFMVDVKRPVAGVVEAMQKEKVYIGRSWPVWPTHVRISIGTPQDMRRFETAFLKVMA